MTAASIRLILGAGLLSASFASAAVTHSGKLVGNVFPPDGRGCAFFTLSGVPVADSSVSSTMWFSVPVGSQGFKEIYALLLTARVSDIEVTVGTTGNAACGHAELDFIHTTI